MAPSSGTPPDPAYGALASLVGEANAFAFVLTPCFIDDGLDRVHFPWVKMYKFRFQGRD